MIHHTSFSVIIFKSKRLLGKYINNILDLE